MSHRVIENANYAWATNFCLLPIPLAELEGREQGRDHNKSFSPPHKIKAFLLPPITSPHPSRFSSPPPVSTRTPYTPSPPRTLPYL